MTPTAADTGPTVTSGRSDVRTPFRRFFGFGLRTGIIAIGMGAVMCVATTSP